MVDVDSLRSVALDWLGVDLRPRMIVGADRTIFWINDRAHIVLDHVPTVHVVQQRLCFRVAADEMQFEQFIGTLDDQLGTMAVAFDGRASHLLFRGRSLSRGRAVCLDISLDHAGYTPALADFAKVFGLTSTEAKTAMELFKGQSVSDVACLHKVSVGTVRTHVRQIYCKLGTGNREQFFRRLQPFLIN